MHTKPRSRLGSVPMLKPLLKSYNPGKEQLCRVRLSRWIFATPLLWIGIAELSSTEAHRILKKLSKKKKIAGNHAVAITCTAGSDAKP